MSKKEYHEPKARKKVPGEFIKIVGNKPERVKQFERVARRTIKTNCSALERNGWEGAFDWRASAVTRTYTLNISLAKGGVTVAKTVAISYNEVPALIRDLAISTGEALAEQIRREGTGEEEMSQYIKTSGTQKRKKTEEQRMSDRCKICGDVDNKEYAEWGPCPHVTQ